MSFDASRYAPRTTRHDGLAFGHIQNDENVNAKSKSETSGRELLRQIADDRMLHSSMTMLYRVTQNSSLQKGQLRRDWFLPQGSSNNLGTIAISGYLSVDIGCVKDRPTWKDPTCSMSDRSLPSKAAEAGSRKYKGTNG
jgi:hypothetical protein